MSDVATTTLCNLYTSFGGLVCFYSPTKQVIHQPAGVAPANLLMEICDGVGRVFERQPFGARPLRIERQGTDRLKGCEVSNGGASSFVEVAQTASGQVTLRWDGAFLTAMPSGEIALSAAPNPDLSCFWLLEPAPVFSAPVFTLSRRDGGSISAADFLPNLTFPQLEELIASLVRDRRLGAALDLMAHIVNDNYLLHPFHGRSLFTPGLDQALFTLSNALLDDARPAFAPVRPGTRLIVASELYLSGGHSRVVEDLARLPGQNKIVITDCFGNHASGRIGLEFLVQRLPGVEIAVVARTAREQKARVLLSTVAQYGPSEIFLLGHHQDPVPSAALASAQIPYRRIFIHHTDHNISLGATCDAFEQVHITRYVARVVEAVRKVETAYLPLCVHDLGMKPMFEQVDSIRSTVTSGSNVKYRRSGPLPYGDVVRAILSVVPGDHFHIGPLDADWVAEIRSKLDEAGLDGSRFKYLGIVPSLWDALLRIDAQVYITSAPIGGGRAAIEAQGAGFPVLFFSSPSKSVLTQVDEVYANKALRWNDADELARLLVAVSGELPAHSRQARTFYEESFSGELFADRVGQLATGRAP